MGESVSISNILRKCPTHRKPYEGICGEPNCNLCGLICYSCNPNPCTKSLEHKLISIQEYYENFYKKLLLLVDIKKLKSFLDTAKKINKFELDIKKQNFNEMEQKLIDKKLNDFKERLKLKIENFHKNLIEKFNKINNDYVESFNIDYTSIKIPENFNLEETTKFITNNINNPQELENIIFLIKKFSDNDKLSKNQKDLENLIYGKIIYDSFSNIQIQEKYTSIENIFESNKKNLYQKIFPDKKDLGLLFLEKRFKSDPNKLKFNKNLYTKCQKSYTIDSVFTAFQAKDGNCYLATPNNSNYNIEIYDLQKDEVTKVLKGHKTLIYIVRHYFQHSSQKDFLISTCSEKKCIVWDLSVYQSLFVLDNCHKGIYLYSALLLFHRDENYIITSSPNEYIKVWDFKNGKFLKEIGSNTDYTYFINYWINNDKIYIINANSSNIKIYGMEGTKDLYREFSSNPGTWHMSAFVEKLNNVDYLFESDGNGFLRIWNIENKTIFKEIQCKGCNFRGLCFWNEKYILVASSDKGFKVVDIENCTFTHIGGEGGHTNVLCTLQKIYHPFHGECLISSGIDGYIKLWITSEKDK